MIKDILNLYFLVNSKYGENFKEIKINRKIAIKDKL